jgi:hypothetical protein
MKEVSVSMSLPLYCRYGLLVARDALLQGAGYPPAKKLLKAG